MYTVYVLVFCSLACVQLTRGNQKECILEDAGILGFGKGGDVTVYDGKDLIYISGGEINGTLWTQDILQYNITSQQTEFYTSIPVKNDGGIAFGTSNIDRNGTIYYFGGNSNGEYKSEIYKITKEHPNITEHTALLPSTSAYHASVYDERNDVIYILGGLNTFGGLVSTITKYDIQTNETTTLGSPKFEGAKVSAVRVMDNIYIFGGSNTTNPGNSIYKFDLSSGKIVALEEKLPKILGSSSAVLVGEEVYILGQVNGSNNLLIQFDTNSETVVGTTEIQNFQSKHISTGSTVYIPENDRIYLVTGRSNMMRYIQLDCVRGKVEPK